MAEKWIAKAVKKKGSLTRTAKRASGMSKRTGKLKSAWLQKAAKKKGKTGKRARLAITLRKISRGGT